MEKCYAQHPYLKIHGMLFTKKKEPGPKYTMLRPSILVSSGCRKQIP